MNFRSAFCMVIVFLLFLPGCKFFQPRPSPLLRRAGVLPPDQFPPKQIVTKEKLQTYDFLKSTVPEKNLAPKPSYRNRILAYTLYSPPREATRISDLVETEVTPILALTALITLFALARIHHTRSRPETRLSNLDPDDLALLQHIKETASHLWKKNKPRARIIKLDDFRD